MIVLGAEIKHRSKFLTKEGRAYFRRLQEQTMLEVAEWWVDRIVRRRLSSAQASKYQRQARTDWYQEFRKKPYGVGQGRFVENVFSGFSRRNMLAFPKFVSSSKRVVVRLPTRKYFTRPYIGSFVKGDGRTGIISQQPDKKTEIERNNTADNKEARRQIQKRLGRYARQPGPTRYTIRINRG